MEFEKENKLLTLLRGIASRHHHDFYYLNCFYSFRTENNFNPHDKECKNKDFCGIVMP